MRQGKFIVIEGIDGAGKTTQVAAMVERTDCHPARQPSQLPVGRLIREELGRAHSRTGDGASRVHSRAGDDARPSSERFALMWATDRLDQQEREIAPVLRRGHSVICDRWYHSSMAYQAGGTVTWRWIREINRHAIEPDLTIFLNADPDAARQRIAARGGDAGIFDGELDRVAGNYRDAVKLLKNDYQENILVVDADRDRDEISDEIQQAILSLHRS